MTDWQEALSKRYAWAERTSFAVGEGWRELVERTFARLDALASAQGEQDPDLGLRVLDVKEKYGTLQMDVVPFRDDAEAIVDDAERQSETICDVCGKPGSLRGDAWLSTKCDEHSKK